LIINLLKSNRETKVKMIFYYNMKKINLKTKEVHAILKPKMFYSKRILKLKDNDLNKLYTKMRDWIIENMTKH